MDRPFLNPHKLIMDSGSKALSEDSSLRGISIDPLTEAAPTEVFNTRIDVSSPDAILPEDVLVQID